MPGSADAHVVVVDNHDSFTWNLVHALTLAGARCTVVANDERPLDALLSLAPDGWLISAGPCTPAEAGVSVPLVRALATGPTRPLLGVCLGLQCLAVGLGGRVVASADPRHGATAAVRHDGRGLFAGAPSPLAMARYNSLCVDPATLPAELEPCAWDEHGELMGLRHRSRPLEAVQFHPESHLSEGGADLLASWLQRVRLMM